LNFPRALRKLDLAVGEDSALAGKVSSPCSIDILEAGDMGRESFGEDGVSLKLLRSEEDDNVLCWCIRGINAVRPGPAEDVVDEC